MSRFINLTREGAKGKVPNVKNLPEWKTSRGAVRILELLLRYRYLTRELIEYSIDQGHGRGAYQARHELTRLWRYGLVKRFARPAMKGSSQYVYVATVAGAELVLPPKDLGVVRKEVQNRADRPLTNFEHALAVSLLQILWEQGAREVPAAATVAGGYWVERDAQDVIGQGFKVSLEPDPDWPVAKKARQDGRKLKIKPYTVFPDTIVLLEWKGRPWPLFVEIERTHKNDRRERERFRAYGVLLGKQYEVVQDVFEQMGYGRPGRGVVVFIGATDKHAESLFRSADGAMQSLGFSKRNRPPMLFSSLDQLFETVEYVDEDTNDPVGEEESIITPASRLFTDPLFQHWHGGRQGLLAPYGRD